MGVVGARAPEVEGVGSGQGAIRPWLDLAQDGLQLLNKFKRNRLFYHNVVDTRQQSLHTVD